MTTTERLEVNGISLSVTSAGEGPAVLMLHGFPDSARLWRHQIPALLDSGYRIIAPDLRGFGESERPKGVDSYSLMNVIGDLTALLDHFEVDRAHVVGHDWGAGAAWILASLVPQRVASLTALSVGRFQGAAASIEQLRSSWYMFMFQFEGVAEEWLSRNDWEFLRSFLRGGEDPERYIADLSRPGALTAALNWYRANIPPSLWILDRLELPAVKAPTMGVWSSGDLALTEQQMVDSKRFVEGPWRYERLEDVGHWIPLEAPDKLTHLLLDFLATA